MASSNRQFKVLGAIALFVALIAAIATWGEREDSQLADVPRAAVPSGEAEHSTDTSLVAAAPRAERENLSDELAHIPKPAARAEDNDLDVEWEEAPEDPKEKGNCALRLTLLDRETQAPIASSLHLYRINAPENEFYGVGDQLQVETHVPVEGVLLSELPEGEYRAIVHKQSRKQPSPPSFQILEGVNEHTLTIDLPKEATAWLEIYAADGHRIELAFLMPVDDEVSWHDQPNAEWIRRRACKLQNVFTDFFSFSFSESEEFQPEPLRTQATDRGFALQGIRESAYGFSRVFVFDVLVENHSAVRVRIDPDETAIQDASQMQLVAVVGELSDLLPQLVLPGGRDGSDIADDVEAVCIARLTKELSHAPWLDLDIDVYVQSEGFERLKFSWSPALGPAELQVLVPKP